MLLLGLLLPLSCEKAEQAPKTNGAANEDENIRRAEEEVEKAQSAFFDAQARLKKEMLALLDAEDAKDDVARTDALARESKAVEDVAAAKKELERLERLAADIKANSR